MLTIYKRELSHMNHSLGSYLFLAIMMLAIGLGAMVYNINNAVANFEYVLGTASIAYVVLIPVLTMKSIAEERKQKTDQLLYSLPLDMWEIVFGKFLAYVTALALPVLMVCAYPLIFANYGNVYLPTSYGTLFAFFLLGVAWIAVGMFMSSITESLPFAAVGTVIVIILNYFLTSLGSLISDAFGSFCAKLSLFERFYNFADGVFDMTSVVFFLSVTGVFLFLCVQMLEKRRYS